MKGTTTTMKKQKRSSDDVQLLQSLKKAKQTAKANLTRDRKEDEVQPLPPPFLLYNTSCNISTVINKFLQ